MQITSPVGGSILATLGILRNGQNNDQVRVAHDQHENATRLVKKVLERTLSTCPDERSWTSYAPNIQSPDQMFGPRGLQAPSGLEVDQILNNKTNSRGLHHQVFFDLCEDYQRTDQTAMERYDGWFNRFVVVTDHLNAYRRIIWIMNNVYAEYPLTAPYFWNNIDANIIRGMAQGNRRLDFRDNAICAKFFPEVAQLWYKLQGMQQQRQQVTPQHRRARGDNRSHNQRNAKDD